MGSEKQNLSIGGRIVISEKSPAFCNGTAHIYLEGVSRADAESVFIVETIVENIRHEGEGKQTEILFSLEIADENQVSPQNSYSVRVWIDTDVNDGQFRANDLFSDRAYRVLTRGFGNSVEVKIGF